MRFPSFALPALILAVNLPTAAVAESPPETLLAKDSVAYVRFDGLSQHRPAYNKTVFAELLATEFQPLIDHVWKMIFDAIGPQMLSERLLQGVPPAELIRLQKGFGSYRGFSAGSGSTGSSSAWKSSSRCRGGFA